MKPENKCELGIAIRKILLQSIKREDKSINEISKAINQPNNSLWQFLNTENGMSFDCLQEVLQVLGCSISIKFVGRYTNTFSKTISFSSRCDKNHLSKEIRETIRGICDSYTVLPISWVSAISGFDVLSCKRTSTEDFRTSTISKLAKVLKLSVEVEISNRKVIEYSYRT